MHSQPHKTRLTKADDRGQTRDGDIRQADREYHFFLLLGFVGLIAIAATTAVTI